MMGMTIVRQLAQHQEAETKALKLNSAIIYFNIHECAFSSVTSQNLCCSEVLCRPLKSLNVYSTIIKKYIK